MKEIKITEKKRKRKVSREDTGNERNAEIIRREEEEREKGREERLE